MATNATLALTSSDGTAFSVDANKVIYAYDDSNSKAVLTYQTEKGINAPPVTLSISTVTLQALSTNILFILTTIESDLIQKDVCFNNGNVLKIFGSGHCTMTYLLNNQANAQNYTIDDTAANVSTAAKTTISVTDNVTSEVYYINGFRASNITGETETDTTLLSAVIAAPGTGQIVGDILPLTGGTYTTQATVTVDTTQPVSLATNAAGSSYNVSDTILTAGGTASTHATLTVTHIKAVTAPAVTVGGAGYTTGDHVSLTTGTGTQAIFTVTAVAGAATALSAIFLAGDYTVRPTLGGAVVTTAITGGGAGLTVNLVAADFGVLTATITTPGSYTVNNAAFTQNTSSGAGTGATFNTVIYGVNTVTISNAGAYTSAPTNPVAQGTSSGAGVGATFTTTFNASGTVTGASIMYNDEVSQTPPQLDVKETVTQVTAKINAL